MAIQFYTPSSDGPISGFMEGRKFKQDEAYRKALDMMKAEEFAKKELGGFQKRTVGPEGYTSGFEANQPNVDQAIEHSPEAYLNKGMSGTPDRPDPAVALEKNASTERARLAALEASKASGFPTDQYETPASPGAPEMPPPPPQPEIGASHPLAQALSPQPLLKSKESVKQEAAFSNKPGNISDQTARGAEIRKEDLGEPQLVGSEGGINRYLQYANKAAVNQGKDAAVDLLEPLPEDKIIPGTPPTPPKLPTLEQMAAIDRQRFSGQKDASKDISVDTLPIDMRRSIGIPDEYHGTIDRDILKALIEGVTKKKETVDKSLHNAVYEAADSILNGVPVATAARVAMIAKQGPLTTQESDFLKSMVGQGLSKEKAAEAAKRAEEAAAFRKAQSDRLSPNETIKVQDGRDAYKAIKSLRESMKGKSHLFGPVKGTIGSWNPYNEEAQVMESEIGSSRQVAAKFLEGGVLRAEDEKKYKKMMPTLGDSFEVAQKKTEIVINKLIDKANGYVDALGGGGYNVSQFEKLVKELEAFREENRQESGISSSAGAIDKAAGEILGGGKGSKKTNSADSEEYDSERGEAISQMRAFRAKVQEKMLKEKKSIQWASQMVDNQEKIVDKYLRDTYGRGLNGK